MAATLASASRPAFDVRCQERGAETLAALAASSDVLATLFEGEQELEAALFADEGVLAGAHGGLRLVDLTPASPDFAVKVSERFAAAGARAYAGALSGESVYMDAELAADTHAFEVVRNLAPAIRVTGATGSSKALAIIEGLLACVTARVCEEALALGEKAGIPAAALIALLLKGSGGNQALRDGSSRNERTTAEVCERDIILAQALGRDLGHPVSFGALALARAACRGAAGREAVTP